MPADAAPPPLPHALDHLTGLARALATPAGLPDGLRTWVTIPTSRLGISASIIGALAAEPGCAGCFHADVRVGDHVVAYVDRRFEDTRLLEITDTFFRHRTRIPRATAPAPRLPDNFPERPFSRLADDERTRLAAAYGCQEPMAGHQHIRASLHPVVVVGLPDRTQCDLTVWDQIPGIDRRAVLRATAGDVDDWYRAPLLTVGSMPSLVRRPWLAQVRPRLVITTTNAAALAATPWPDVPVLSLLSRRSPSTVPTAELIQQMPTTPAVIAGRLGLALRPGHGLEIHAAYLAATQAMPVTDDDSDEEDW